MSPAWALALDSGRMEQILTIQRDREEIPQNGDLPYGQGLPAAAARLLRVRQMVTSS